MKNSFNFLFLAFMLVAQGACVKNTSISGTISEEICGNSFTEIRWGSQPNQPLTLHAGVQRDSIFCPRNDTTEYLLKL
jgi:hypothetical protein